MFHTVQQGDTFFRIAKKYNISVDNLLEMNNLKAWDTLRLGQSLRVAKGEPQNTEKNTAITNSKTVQEESFYIVQSGDSLSYIAGLYKTSPLQILTWNNLAANATIYVGQKLKVKAGDVNLNTVPNPATGEAEEFYVVQKGDSLFAISRRFSTTPEEILKMNALSLDASIYAGQRLKVRKISTNTPIENKPNNQVDTISTSKTDITPSNTSTSANTQTKEIPSSASAGSGAGGLVYTVQKGDSLFSISRMFKVSPEKILIDNGLALDATIFVGQSLKIQTSQTTTVSLPQIKLYTVKQGDSILSIAQQFGVAPQKLLEMNGFNKETLIYVGQEIKVSGGDNVGTSQEGNTTVRTANTYKVQSGDSLANIAQRFNTSPAAILAENNLQLDATIYIGQLLRIPPQPTPTSATPPKQKGDYETYTVQAGDWLSKIASDFRVSPEAIMKLNNMPNNSLTVGQNLLIPKAEPANVPIHLVNKSKSFEKARKIFEVEELNGKEIFGGGLKGTVGGSGKTNPEDLEKIQTRLVQLGLLSNAHNETPLMLKQRLRGGDIWPDSIPQTIAAIGKFQSQYKVSFWAQTPARIAMMGTDKYTPNVITPNDLTYKILREHTKYKISFPHPVSQQKITAEFTNFVVSGFNEYYDGVGYKGQSQTDLPLEVFKALGLDEGLAMAVKYVSKHEGNFDAINSFDKAIFSYGLIQFAGTPSGGALGRLLGRMKWEQPKYFEEHFQRFGIDVEYQMKNGKISFGEIKVFDLKTKTGKFEVTGIEAEKAIRADKQLYGCFLRAGYEPALMISQIGIAIDDYVRPALNIRLDINSNGLQLQNLPLTDIINSTMGLTTAIDLTVNQWINRTRDYFRLAIEAVMVEDNIDTVAELKMIDERKVLQKMVAQATDARVTKRTTSVLESETLTPTKRPNYVPFVS
jgi:peptidoglycan endopeptidase LytF